MHVEEKKIGGIAKGGGNDWIFIRIFWLQKSFYFPMIFISHTTRIVKLSLEGNSPNLAANEAGVISLISRGTK